MAKASDNFNRADENPMTGWTGGFTSTESYQIVSNRPKGLVVNNVQEMSFNGVSPGGDQYVKVQTGSFNSSPAATYAYSLHTRKKATPDREYYFGKYTRTSTPTNTTEIRKILTGSGSTGLASESTSDFLTAADEMTVLCRGSNISLFKNGTPLLNATDSGITTGNTGLGGQVTTGGSLTDMLMDNFSAGDLPITFVAAGTEGSAASGNVSPGLPAGIQANDILIMVYHGSDQVAVTVDAAWTAAVTQANGGSTTSRMGVWWHRYDGSTNPSTTITHASGQTPIAGIAAFRGCKTSGSPINAAGTIAGGTDATMEAGTITPTVDNCLVLALNGAADDNARTLLAGYTNVFVDGANNAFVSTAGTPDGSVSMFFRDWPTASVATGTVTVTMAASDPWAAVLIALEPASTDVTLTVGQGSYTLTGKAVTLLRNRLVAAAQGSYTLSGQAVTLRKNTPITIGQGSYTLSGKAVNLLRNRLVAAAQGSYALSGQAVVFQKGRTITVAQGSYTLSGKTVALLFKHSMPAAQGSYALSGKAVTFLKGRTLSVGQGSYALSGQASSLLWKHRITAAQGAYALSGQAASLLFGRELSAAQGSYALSGKDAALISARLLAAAQGSYTLTGEDAALTQSSAGTGSATMVADFGLYALTGRAVLFFRSVPPPAPVVQGPAVWIDTELHNIAGFGSPLEMGGRPFGGTAWLAQTVLFIPEWLDTELHSIAGYGSPAEMGSHAFGGTPWVLRGGLYVPAWLDTELHDIAGFGSPVEMGSRPFGGTTWTVTG